MRFCEAVVTAGEMGDDYVAVLDYYAYHINCAGELVQLEYDLDEHCWIDGEDIYLVDSDFLSDEWEVKRMNEDRTLCDD